MRDQFQLLTYVLFDCSGTGSRQLRKVPIDMWTHDSTEVSGFLLQDLKS